MMTAMLVLVFVFVVVMMTAMLVFVFFVVMMAAMFVFFVFRQEFVRHFFRRRTVFHCRKNFLAVKFVQRGRDYRGVGVAFFYERETFRRFCFGSVVGMTEDYAIRVFKLVEEEFAEVFRVHKAFFNVYDGGFCVDRRAVKTFFHRFFHVAEFAYARRLDYDSVGSVIFGYFFQRFGKIAYETATNATAVHFGYFHAGVA